MVDDRSVVDWAFDVTRLIRGNVSDRPVARVAIGDDASCGFGIPLVAGATYEVGGHVGELPEGESRVFVNTCGGSLRQPQAAPPPGRAVPIEGVQEKNDSPAGWVSLALGVLAVAGVGGALALTGFLRLRGRAHPLLALPMRSGRRRWSPPGRRGD
jgi:hypothetical protein